MLAEPTQEMYGLQIGQTAELPSGTIHPILARLEGCGWLESHWEDLDPAKEGRTRRRCYRLTPTALNSPATPSPASTPPSPYHPVAPRPVEADDGRNAGAQR